MVTHHPNHGPVYPDERGEQAGGRTGLTRGPAYRRRHADWVETAADKAHIVVMADTQEEPVMLPFKDKSGTGWHVVIRYHTGHERLVDGFAGENEALEWIIANSTQVDQQPP